MVTEKDPKVISFQLEKTGIKIPNSILIESISFDEEGKVKLRASKTNKQGIEIFQTRLCSSLKEALKEVLGKFVGLEAKLT